MPLSDQVDVPSILCHPDSTKSCGACCGMYNHVGASRSSTMERLSVRTAAFYAEADIADPESLAAFRDKWEPTENKLLVWLPSCPFLGLIGQNVGCLVHPLLNGGADGRDCGVYDRATCDDYLCAAHAVLRPIEKWLVIAALDDSFVYGLVVTDPLFVRQLLEQTATLNGAMPSNRQVMANPRAATRYLRLKAGFPYGGDDAILGQVTGSSGLDTPRRMGPSEALGVESDRWESILRCLGATVADESELDDARHIVEEAVREFADAVAL